MLDRTRTQPSWRDAMSALDVMARNARDAREAEEGRREQLQIKARAIDVPSYDNSDLFNLERWIVRNLEQLTAYFHQLAAANNEPVLSAEEIRVMTVIQYERQLALRDLIPPRERDLNQAAVDRYARNLLARSDVHEQSGIRYQGEI